MSVFKAGCQQFDSVIAHAKSGLMSSNVATRSSFAREQRMIEVLGESPDRPRSLECGSLDAETTAAPCVMLGARAHHC